MRKALLATACISLCMGQTCVPGAPEPQGILAGLYNGQIPWSATATGTDGQGQPIKLSQSASSMIPRNFGSNGGFLSADGTPVALGAYITQDIGVWTATLTVKSILMNAGRLHMMWDVTMSGCDADGCITFSGFANEVYTQVDPNNLDYQCEMTLGFSGDDGSSGIARYFYDGTLTK